MIVGRFRPNTTATRPLHFERSIANLSGNSEDRAEGTFEPRRNAAAASAKIGMSRAFKVGGKSSTPRRTLAGKS